MEGREERKLKPEPSFPERMVNTVRGKGRKKLSRESLQNKLEKGVRMVLAGEMRAVREDEKETREPCRNVGKSNAGRGSSQLQRPEVGLCQR